VVDEVRPYGSVMAGDWLQDPPWRQKKRARDAAREAVGSAEAG
jgi:hypothetical protein